MTVLASGLLDRKPAFEAEPQVMFARSVMCTGKHC